MIKNGVETLSALIGLCGAISNNGKTSNTDCIVKNAILFLEFEDDERTDLSEMSDEKMADILRKEKFVISPNCATCKFPCGNTSDYDMQLFYDVDDETAAIKIEVLKNIKELVRLQDMLPDVVYKAISFIGYNLEVTSYEKLIEEIKNG